MPPPYNDAHWNQFVDAGYQPQGPVGDVPAQWANGLPQAPADLPEVQLTRQEVQKFCRDANTDALALFGYVCAIAWGGQNDRFTRSGKPGHKTLSWSNRNVIVPKLLALRAGGLSHCQAYALFSGQNHVAGLGPAFFTKLIYFFSPARPRGQTGFYIMDQWTAKSINLLTQQPVVRLARIKHTSPQHSNKCGNYEAFCREIEHIAAVLELNNPDGGDVVEQRLMSEGGHQPQPWREHVRKSWPRHAPEVRYNRHFIHNVYHQIPLNCF